MTDIELPFPSNEAESLLRSFFRQFKNSKTQFGSNTVRFSAGSVWSMIDSLHPNNEIVEGNIQILPLDENNTLLKVKFSRQKIMLLSIIQNIVAIIAFWIFLIILISSKSISIIFARNPVNCPAFPHHTRTSKD